MRQLGFVLVAVMVVVTGMRTAHAEYLEFTQADVDKAVKAKNYTLLLDYCQHNANLDAAWKSACTAVLDNYVAKGDAGSLLKICNNEDKAWHTDFYEPACERGRKLTEDANKKALADCSKVKDTWTKKPTLGEDAEKALYLAVGQRAAECKLWDFVWVDLVHQANGRGPELIKTLEKAGVALDVELMTYLAANKDKPFAFEYGDFALENITSWLVSAGKVGKCERFIPYAKNATPETLGKWLHFFAEAKCKAAAPLAVPRLSSKVPDQRRQACAVLGEIGSKKDIAKLTILSKTDPEYRVERMTKIYWVRDACQAAIGAIQLK